MHELLHSIDAGLKRLGRTKTLSLLRPGLPVDEVHRSLQALELESPEDLACAYAWHDGTDASTGVPLDDLHLFPGFYFLSLHDACANHKAFRDDDRWDESWFPILANGGGDFFAVVCATGPQYGRVVHFRIDALNHPVEYSSTEALFRTIATAYEDGVFFVDEHGYLEMSDPVFIALAGRLNADVEFWRP